MHGANPNDWNKDVPVDESKPLGKDYWLSEFYKGFDAPKSVPLIKIDWLHVFLVVFIVGALIWGLFLTNQVNDLEVAVQASREDIVKDYNETVAHYEKLLTESTADLNTARSDLSREQREIDRYKNRLKEYEAVKAQSETDITNYIIRNYKKTPPSLAKEIAKTILIKSEEHNVPFVATIAVIEVESQFNPFAVSPLKKDPARGLMQVRPGVWMKSLGLSNKHDLHDVEKGIDAGCRVLRIYLDETKDNMKKALYKYVGGDKAYGKKVYESMGKFVVYRSFVN